MLQVRGGMACNARMELSRSGWNFHERLDRSSGVVTHWVKKEKLSVRAQASLERMIDQLKLMPRQQWIKPRASFIANHTYVIRFKDVGDVQLRIFGHFYEPHRVFVMTANGYEKNDTYYPENYKEIAVRHKAYCDEKFSSRTIAYGSHCALCTE